MPTLAEVLNEFREEARANNALDWGELHRRLLAREDDMADQIRLAGSQLGTFPELVAGVLDIIGLGTPNPPDVSTLLRQQFTARIEWLHEQFRNQHPEA